MKVADRALTLTDLVVAIRKARHDVVRSDGFNQDVQDKLSQLVSSAVAQEAALEKESRSIPQFLKKSRPDSLMMDDIVYPPMPDHRNPK